MSDPGSHASEGAAPAAAPPAAAPPATIPAPTAPERSLAALPGVLASMSEPAEGSSRLLDLLRTAGRHCRKLVDAQSARIWLARRSGRRLVAREFPDGNSEPIEVRLARGEGLVGWVFSHGQPLRLGPGDERPVFRGHVPEFRSALVVPLFRRGKVFAAIECLDRHGQDGTPVEFAATDQDVLEVAAEHIAFALDHALLYEETKRRALEMEVLLEVAKALSAPLDLDEVLSAIFESLRQVVQFDGAAVYLVNRRSQGLECVSCIGYPEGSEEAFRLHVGVGLVGWVAKTGEGVIVSDVRNDPRYVVSRIETRSEIAAPLILNDKTIGVFNLESDQEDAYHEGHLQLLSAFASQAAIAVERARLTRELLERRRLEKELAIAREIQESFLPKAPPRIPGFDLAGTARSHHEVGGDYYDFIPVSDGNLGLAIADVSGKGIPAALIMAGFRMSLLAEIRNDFAIRAVMRKVNSLLYESTERDKFVTAFYGVLDVKNRLLVFSNAGHNPPVIARRDGVVDVLLEGGIALGVLPEAQYEERPLELRSGDVVVLYTDGVSEAVSPDGEQFGEQRIAQCLRELVDRPAAAIVDGIVEAVLAWSGDPGPADDLTLLVVKVLD